jgi:hypothetical protein
MVGYLKLFDQMLLHINLYPPYPPTVLAFTAVVTASKANKHTNTLIINRKAVTISSHQY